MPHGKPRRGRLTGNPMLTRANGNSARGKRLRDLYAAFEGKLTDPNDVVGRAAALRAAELTATAEDIRESIRAVDLKDANADTIKQLATLADQLVRIENLADRAERRVACWRRTGRRNRRCPIILPRNKQ